VTVSDTVMDNAASISLVMELAEEEALSLGHPYLGTEHQLLGLLRAGDAAVTRLIASNGTSAEAIRARLLESLPSDLPRRLDPNAPLPHSARAKKVLKLASQSETEGGSGGLRLLRAFFSEGNNVAAAVLQQSGISSV
jgi:ATP-dependent Clp protease ATP-binding subunit ClpC